MKFKKIIISESERGFLIKKGRFIKMLSAGSYIQSNNKQIFVTKISEPLTSRFDMTVLNIFLKDENFKNQVIIQEVPDKQVAVHEVDGHFKEILKSGKYIYWEITEHHSFQLYDMTNPEIPADTQLCENLYKAGCMAKLGISENQKGLLFINEKFEKELTSGIYYFWQNGSTRYQVRYIEMKKRLLNLTGQEILTKDKVGIRLNFVCNFQVIDCVKACLEIDDYEEQFRTAVQLTVREFVAECTLDEILAQRDKIAKQILEILKPKAKILYIDVWDAGIKDIILPGDVREIINTVLLAEKKAQANVITRREEVASTRSLLNTAKLMDENKTLYKLKELEYLEKICENVGNISVSGGDLLEHLRAIIGSDKN